MVYLKSSIFEDAMENQVELAIEVLKKGGIVAFPTDTVYGIGGNSFIEQAVAKVYQIKQRPRHLALPLLISSKPDLERVARVVPEVAWRLADRFLPGGLTLVLKKAAVVPDIVAPGDTVAVRIPDHPIPIALIRGLGAPLIGTSANPSGGAIAVTAQQVWAQLGNKVDLIVDGGRCRWGVESTVVDVSGEFPRVLREGVVSRREIEELCGYCI